MNVKKQILNSSTWTVLGTASQQLVTFFIFIYLARLLSPEVFGLVAMATAFTDILEMAVFCGQANILLQKRDVDDRVLSTSFWIIVSLGICVGLFIFSMSGVAAWFFGEPDLGVILATLSVLPGLSAIGAVHEAQIRRQLRFRSLAIRNVSATLVSGTVALFLAYRGYGIHALIAQRLTFGVVSATLLFAAKPWIPKLIFDKREARHLLVNGLRIAGNSISTRLSPRILDFLVGYFLGARSLGLLRVSLRFFDFLSQGILTPISDVLPAVLRNVADDKAAVLRIYRRLVTLAATVFFPLTIGVGLMSTEVTELIFGPKWVEAAPLIQILSLLAFTLPVSTFFTPLMLTLGKTRGLSLMGILRILSVMLFAIAAAQVSVFYVVIGYILSSYLITWISTKLLGSAIDMTWPKILSAQAPALLATGTMAAVIFGIKSTAFYAALTNVKEQMLIGVTCGGLTYASVLLVGSALKLWPQYKQDIMSAIPQIKSKNAAPMNGE